MHKERRRVPRYPVKREVLEVVIHETGLRGAVRDMSTGGLAFEYTPAEDKEEASNMIDILCSVDPRYCRHAIPCRMVYDIAVLSEDRSFRGGAFRRRGLKYHAPAEALIRNMQPLFDVGERGPV